MGKETWKPGNMLYPLPVVMVTCKRKDEKPNIITLAWTGTVCSEPPMLSISVRKERFSHDIIMDSGEFVVNLTTRDIVLATDYCGVKSGRDQDKFKATGLTPVPSDTVAVPGIAESPVNIECRVRQVVELGSHDMFIADITGVRVDSRYLEAGGKFRLNDTDLITYSHGEYYTLGEKLGTFGYSVRKSNKK